tara:strand:- start:2084 stop:2617 length:534 start_codon:yes stop_codon:yes gene_type:complete
MRTQKFSNSKLKSTCQKIQLLITDVDGVLTDGGRYYSNSGETLKKFHVRDGMGVNILLRNGIKTIIITKENSKIVKIWSKEMNIHKTFSGIKNKESLLSKICKLYSVNPSQIAYIGDDVNDIPLMNMVGLAVSPNDCDEKTKSHANYLCKLNGGNGAFREVVNLIMKYRFPKTKSYY